MKLNFFNSGSPLFDFRWFIILTISVMGFMAWHDLTGGRMFSVNSTQQWNSKGPGSHK